MTQYTVNSRFEAVNPSLELAWPFPGLRHVRGLRISAATGIVFSRDDMSGGLASRCMPRARGVRPDAACT